MPISALFVNSDFLPHSAYTQPVEILTVGEVKERLGLEARQVRNLCESGALPGAKLKGRVWLIPEAAVEALIEQRREELRKQERTAGRPPKCPP